MGQQRTHQKKTTAATRSQPTKSSVKSPVHPVEELQGAIGNREMGRLMETNRQGHPSSPFPKLQGELPLLGGMMPVSQGTIQRQPLFRGLSQELRLDTAMALPTTGAVIQPKLTLGTPGDMYEEEADRVARQEVNQLQSPKIRQTAQNQTLQREAMPVEERELPEVDTVERASWDSAASGVRQENKTGLPDNLKAGIEALSGLSMDDVKVYYNSDKPAQLQALAYTQSTDIYVESGEERHLPHEAWHVVQQKQGRVQPTVKLTKEGYANEESRLEREADLYGDKAERYENESRKREDAAETPVANNGITVIQRMRGTVEVRREGDGYQIEGRPDFDTVVKRIVYDQARADGEEYITCMTDNRGLTYKLPTVHRRHRVAWELMRQSLNKALLSLDNETFNYILKLLGVPSPYNYFNHKDFSEAVSQGQYLPELADKVFNLDWNIWLGPGDENIEKGVRIINAIKRLTIKPSNSSLYEEATEAVGDPRNKRKFSWIEKDKRWIYDGLRQRDETPKTRRGRAAVDYLLYVVTNSDFGKWNWRQRTRDEMDIENKNLKPL